MNIVAFDTLAYSEELKSAGIPEAQAMAQVRALARAIESKDLVTKADLKELELKLEAEFKDVRGEIKDVRGEIKDVRGEIKDVRTELKGDIKELELRMDTRFAKTAGELRLIKWMLFLVVAATVIPALKQLFDLAHQIP